MIHGRNLKFPTGSVNFLKISRSLAIYHTTVHVPSVGYHHARVKQRVLDAMKTKATNCRNFLSFSLLLAMSPPRTSRFTGRKLATIHTDSKPAYMRTAEQQWTMYHIWPYHTSLRLHNENPRTFSPK